MAVYLLHFDRPYPHARHYLGYSADPEERLREHQQGSNARLVRAAVEAGVRRTIARVWEGNRAVEAAFKRRNADKRRFGARHGLKRYCPICRNEEGNIQ